MWYIFPQFAGLGKTETSTYYALQDIGEAEAFLLDQDLSLKLVNICKALLELTTDHTQAFERYQQHLEGYVKKVQCLPPGVPKPVYPGTRLSLIVLNDFFRLFGSRPVKYLAKKLSGKKKSGAGEFRLPVYRRNPDKPTSEITPGKPG